MKRSGIQAYLFLLPILVIIAVFSLWPILQSFVYTLFDIQLNNQQKAGLYLSERFNADLFAETQVYMNLFLEESKPLVLEESDQQKLDDLLKAVDQFTKQYEGLEGVQNISAQQKEELLAYHEKAIAVIQDLTGKYELPNGENLQLIADDIKNSIIPSNFIGFAGYQKALQDNRVWSALWNTVIFTIVSVFFEFLFGLALALIMNKAMRGQGLVRTTSLIPWAIPTAVAALMWSYLYDGSSGIVANIFEKIGLVEDSRELLLSATGAMISAIFADVWKTTPYMALLLLAGLQTIPHSLYEAASIDGASRVQTFFKVTLPLLKPSILVALLFRTLDAFRVFDLIYVLTGGGPGGATETLSIYSYKIMFGQTNFGYGSVVVMIMFVCVAIIATIYVKVLGANLMEKQ